MELKGACIFGQSGGPSSVINASAYGVFRAALEAECITKVLGAAHGIKGVLNEQLFDIGQEDAETLSLLLQTPSSALGSCRYKLADPSKDDTDYKKILEVFKKHDVRYFFYNGGNDSMDTCNKISRYMQQVGYECRIMGVPKTIDNDLAGTDHCPGFGSAAKYIATACAEVWRDAHVYDTGTVTIIECMGRNAGWLTAASALAVLNGCAPDLICLPERSFVVDDFIARVGECYKMKGSCVAVVSEGIHDAEGTLISEYASKNLAVDAFGHKQLGGAAAWLASEVKDKIGAKTRAIEFSLLQRCAAHSASATDVEEAYQCGRQAVLAAVSGVSDKMVAMRRMDGSEYKIVYDYVDLSVTANAEHKIPESMLDGDYGVTPEFFNYAMPLILGEPEMKVEDGLPKMAWLKKVLV